jgi:hypothetical protein
LAAGDTCAAPAVIPMANMGYASTTVGLTSDYRYSTTGLCKGLGTNPSPDAVFQTTIPAGNRLGVTVIPLPNGATNWDPVVNLVDSPAANCGTPGADGGVAGYACIGGSDSAFSGGTESFSFANTDTAARTVFIIVGGYSGSMGSFSIITTVAPIPQGDTCTDPVVVNGSQMLTAQSLAGFGNDYVTTGSTGCASSGSGVDRVYRVNVPAGQRVTAAVTPDTGANFNPLVNLIVGACTSPLKCVAGSNLQTTGTDTALYDNTDATAQDVLVLIDTATVAPTGTFGLNVTVGPGGPAGDSCGNASPTITSTQTLTAQSLTTFANNYQSNAQSLCRYAVGPDRAYLVQVPPGNVMRATATGSGADGGLDLGLSIADVSVDCGLGPCLAGSDVLGTAPETVVFSNSPGDGGMQTVRVIVDTRNSAPTDDFSIAFSIAPPPPGESCGNPGTPITADTMLLTESLTNYVSDYSGLSPSPYCQPASGPDRVYAVTIPPMQRMTVTAQATGAGDLTLSVADAVAANCNTLCVTGSDNGTAAEAETLFVDNPTTAPRSVFVVVDRNNGVPATGETYSFNVTLAAIPAPPMGDVCASATPITMSGTLAAQTTAGFNDDYNAGPACNMNLFGTSGYDRAYSVTMNAGQMLSVTVTPPSAMTNDADPAVFLIGGPAASCVATPTTQCLAGMDQGFAGDPETVTYTNSTGAAQTVFIVVDSYYPSNPITTFSLQVTLTP